MGQVQTGFRGIEGQQRVFTLATEKAGADGGGGTQQVNQQPGPFEEVPDQAEIAGGLVVPEAALTAVPLPGRLPEALWHGKVVMNTGDGLHHAAVANTQTVAVNTLHLADIGAAVMGNRYAALPRDDAGHAGAPK